MTQLLSPLALACPALQKLQLKGDNCKSLLAAFGVSCPNLFSLELVSSVAPHTLERMEIMLPHLTKFKFRLARAGDSKDFDGDEDGNTVLGSDSTLEISSSALLPSTTQTCMDRGMLALTPEVWYQLPRGLSQLRCSVIKPPPAGLLVLMHLKHLEIYCDHTQEIELGQLVSILKVGPELETLTLLNFEKEHAGSAEKNAMINAANISRIHLQRCPTELAAESIYKHASINVLCIRDSISKLGFLHDRVLAGLKITCNSLKGESFAGVSLTLRNRDSGGRMEEDNISYLLSNLSTFPMFAGLEVMFGPRHQRHTPSITEHIAAKFPGLKFLQVHSYPITNNDLVHLQACHNLQHLSLRDVCVTAAGLSMLCTCFAALEVLLIDKHSALSCMGDHTVLEHKLQAWFSHVKVVVDS